MTYEQSTNRGSQASVFETAGAPAEGEEHAVEKEDNYSIVEDVHEVHWNANAGPLIFCLSAQIRRFRHVHLIPNEKLHRCLKNEGL